MGPTCKVGAGFMSHKGGGSCGAWITWRESENIERYFEVEMFNNIWLTCGVTGQFFWDHCIFRYLLSEIQ